MNLGKILRIKGKNIVTHQDLAETLGIRLDSAQVLASRYVKSGLLLRLKKNYYVLPELWANFDREEFFRAASFLQVPSYLSFTTALAYYGLTTQIQQNYFESTCLKRTVSYNRPPVFFKYFKLQKKYYFSFVRKNGFFIATPEKALLDCLYLASFGRYSLDIAALDLKKFDKKIIKKLAVIYPEKTRKLVKKICGI